LPHTKVAIGFACFGIGVPSGFQRQNERAFAKAFEESAGFASASFVYLGETYLLGWLVNLKHVVSRLGRG